jgi:hypothetical protein
MTAIEPFVHKNALPLAIGASLLLVFSPYSLWVDQLFLTFIHEASHGIAAVITGGRIASFAVHMDASGVAYTQGGFRPLILLAGYAGSALWGGALLVAARARGLEKAICWSLAGFIGLFTLLFVRNLFGFGVGLGLTAFFAFVARRGAGWQLAFLLSFLAVQCILNAFKDLLTLLILSGRATRTDAHIMSMELTAGLVPPVVFAVVISAITFVLFWGFMRLAWKAGRARPEAHEP